MCFQLLGDFPLWIDWWPWALHLHFDIQFAYSGNGCGKTEICLLLNTLNWKTHMSPPFVVHCWQIVPKPHWVQGGLKIILSTHLPAKHWIMEVKIWCFLAQRAVLAILEIHVCVLGVHVYTCMSLNILCMYVYTHMSVYICVCMHKYVCIIYVCVLYMYVCVHLCVYISMPIYFVCIYFVCACVCIMSVYILCVCVYTSMSVYFVCECVYIHVCVYFVCAWVCTHVCLCICCVCIRVSLCVYAPYVPICVCMCWVR